MVPVAYDDNAAEKNFLYRLRQGKKECFKLKQQLFLKAEFPERFNPMADEFESQQAVFTPQHLVADCEECTLSILVVNVEGEDASPINPFPLVRFGGICSDTGSFDLWETRFAELKIVGNSATQRQ